jgi:hypothetical protein
MMGAMKRRWLVPFSKLALFAAFCSGQTPGPTDHAPCIEIRLPSSVASESFFVRYVLEGQDLGGSVQPRRGVSSFGIGTTFEDHPATGIKAILYAPGCAIQTLDLLLSGADDPQYSFICHPLRNIAIQGVLTLSDRLYGHKVKLQTKYLPRWAQPFLGLDGNIFTTIPVGDTAHLSAEGRFRLAIPDLSQDPLAGAPDHPGELQIWANDEITNALVAKLVPADHRSIRTRMGGLKVQGEYPPEITFAPCPTSSARATGRFGFDVRHNGGDPCDP